MKGRWVVGGGGGGTKCTKYTPTCYSPFDDDQVVDGREEGTMQGHRAVLLHKDIQRLAEAFSSACSGQSQGHRVSQK